MVFNPFITGASNFIKQTQVFYDMQKEFLNSARLLLPANFQSSDMTVLHPDPVDEGTWERAVFTAPKNTRKQFVNELEYYTFIPSVPDKKLHPKHQGIVVMLHGCDQNASVFAQGSQMNLYAQKYGFIVLYPQQNKKHNFAQCWRWYSLDPDSGMAEVNTIMTLISQTIKKYKINPDNVFVAGMSAGAGMANAIAFSFPEKITAVALHSGPVFGQARDVRSGLMVMGGITADSDEELISFLKTFSKPKPHDIPTLIIHGVKDNVVNISNATALSKQALYLNDLPLDTEAIVTRHDIDTPNAYTKKVYCCEEKPIVKVIEVDNMAHAWAGGDTTLPFNTDYGPNSSETILRFFSHYATLPDE